VSSEQTVRNQILVALPFEEAVSSKYWFWYWLQFWGLEIHPW